MRLRKRKEKGGRVGRSTGGEEELELGRCQNEREEEELERSLHLVGMINFLFCLKNGFGVFCF